MEASQQPMQGQQDTGQAMAQPTGDTAPVTTISSSISEEILVCRTKRNINKKYLCENDAM